MASYNLLICKMSTPSVRPGGFAIPDPERAGFRFAVPGQVDLTERDGMTVLVFGSRYAGPGAKQTESPPLNDCLAPFQRLSVASDLQLREFARRWGPLDLCLHMAPDSHSYRCGPLMVEPVAAWRFLASKVTAILNVAAQLRAGRQLPEGDWVLMQDWPTPLTTEQAEAIEGSVLPGSWKERGPRPAWIPPAATVERLLNLERGELGPASPDDRAHAGDDPRRVRLAEEMNWRTVAEVATGWLGVSGVHPRLYGGLGRKPPLTLALGWSGLAGALAMQLVDALAHGDVYICDLCQQPFSTNRRRRPSIRDRNHYCQSCSAHNYRDVKRAWNTDRYWGGGRTPKRRSPTHPDGRKVLP